MAKAKVEIIQQHHLVYSVDKKQKELVVPVRRKVHYYLTILNRFSRFSDFEIMAFENILARHKVLNRLDKTINRLEK